MKLEFTEQEITAGVRHAVQDMGFDLTGKVVTVDYSMGRGKNGLSAAVFVTKEGEATGVNIPGFTDSKEAPAADVAEATSTDIAEAPAATAEGADAAALFGDDD